jgi:hypothetical protein
MYQQQRQMAMLLLLSLCKSRPFSVLCFEEVEEATRSQKELGREVKGMVLLQNSWSELVKQW